MTKRLFLFAGYDKSGCIDDALIHYTHSLSKFGDIVIFMDSDCDASELSKLKKYVLHASGKRHGEYDFGSYKRAYLWAIENLKISDYDFIYLVNDSVYGPLYDLKPYFDKMESGDCDAFGIVKNPHHDHPHIQSWFVGLRKKVFFNTWFNNFMNDITKLSSKGEITRKYEHGLSKLITAHGHKWCCLYTVSGRGIYNKVKKLYCAKMPFMKKVAFTRNHGGLGRQILYILNDTNKKLSNAILSSACAQYGPKHVKWLLTKNPIKIAFRNAYHILYKLFIEGI